MIKLMTLLTQIITVIALALTYLANEWMTEDFGLNPFIALPIATLCMALPYLIDHFFIEIVPDKKDLSCIQLRQQPQSTSQQ